MSKVMYPKIDLSPDTSITALRHF